MCFGVIKAVIFAHSARETICVPVNVWWMRWSSFKDNDVERMEKKVVGQESIFFLKFLFGMHINMY